MIKIKTSKKNGIRILGIILLSILVLVSVLILAVMTPWNISNLSSHASPAQSYDEAVQRIKALQAQEPPGMNPACSLQFMAHGNKTARAIILVHGYTTCPAQFHDLGQRFYDGGYNVLIAPLPRHGLADRMTTEHSRLTAEELAAYADQTVDIARGLGGQVIMMGISLGGVTTAWAAQNRGDIDLAVIISPAFGFKQIPTPLTAAVMNIYMALPDSYEWWNPDFKENTPPPYAYPRYSKHALVQALRLGFATWAGVERVKPAAKKISVVFNASDESVNNLLTVEVVKTWQEHQANLSTYEFEAGLHLPHDIIDPNQEAQKVDIVYPRLISLVTQASE